MKKFRFHSRQSAVTALCVFAPIGWSLFAASRTVAETCDQPHFVSTEHVPTRSLLFDIGVADLDGDGDQDLAIVSDSGLFVSLGDGAGGFGKVAEYNAGEGSSSLALGDFNGDGAPDVITTGSNVAVLLNNGEGGFSAPSFLTAGTQPIRAVTGDFNQDGKLDLAVANFGSSDVSVFLGDGGGGFGGAINFATGSAPNGLVTADFDGDGALDLAVGEYAAMDLRILKGNGDGQFSDGPVYPLGGNAGTVVASDFNGDGKPDLAANVFNISPNDHVATFLGNGDGSFAAGGVILAPVFRTLIASDLNGDGNIDLAVTVSSEMEAIEIATGDGTGNFGPLQQTLFPRGRGNAFGMAAGDLDGFGGLDLVTANYGPHDATVFLNLPLVELIAGGQTASEDGTKSKFRIRRQGCEAEPLTVYYTMGGTATLGVDYQALTGSVTIPADKDSASVIIDPIDDTLVEGTETIIPTLSPDPHYGLRLPGKQYWVMFLLDND